MRKVIVTTILAVVLSVGVAQAQDSSDSWTEVTVTLADKVNGQFAPNLTGAIINFNGGKGIGAFLGENNEAGPLVAWRVWKKQWGALTFSFYTLASTDFSDGTEQGLWNDGVFGIEPRIYHNEFGNAEIAIGVLTTSFREGEKAEWTPYLKLAFRP